MVGDRDAAGDGAALAPSLATRGIAMPRLGFGTFRMTGDACRAAVEGALARGFRHLDTAEMYDNEAEVGAAIAASGLPRDDLFVTTKVWHANLAPDAIRRAFDASLDKLRLERVDLYLVHWPAAGMDLPAVLEAMTRLRESGRARAIGVCNFPLRLMRAAVEQIGAPIACLQVEYHPFLDQSALLDYLAPRGIPLVAYAPLAQGRAASDPVLEGIGRRHGVPAATIALAWLLDQPGVAAIPKAGRPESQEANLAALRVRLDDEDRRAIAALPKDRRYVNPPFAPAWDAPRTG